MSVHHLRGGELARACALGGAAGLAGVAVMTTGEKIEQALTKRPDSFVPARALLTLLGRHPGDDDRPLCAGASTAEANPCKSLEPEDQHHASHRIECRARRRSLRRVPA